MEDEYTSFRWYDYLIFSLTLAVSLGIGIYHACTGGKQRTTKEYLLAGRSMGALPVALSLYVSTQSAISILGSSAELYEHGITLWFNWISNTVEQIIVALVMVPQFYGLGYYSTYTYLEKRYGVSIMKLVGSIFYLISSPIYMGLALYAPAVALQGVTGVPLEVSILASGIVVVIYSSIGGMKGVVATDVFQGLVMIGGCFLVLILGSVHVGGFGEAWERASKGGRLDVDWTPPLLSRLNIYAILFANIPGSVISSGTSQTAIQRQVATKGLRAAKEVILWNIPLSILQSTLIYACGIVVFAYYDKIGCDPLKTRQIYTSNQLLPYFIMDGLKIPCIPGLFVGVLYCGALSSVSSSLNSLSAVTWKNFLEWKFSLWTERQKTTLNKVIVLLYGIIGVSLAFAFQFFKGNILQLTIMILSAFAPFGGVFVLGLLFPWSEWKGALCGVFVTFCFMNIMSLGSTFTYPYVETLPTNDTMCAALGYNITNPRDGVNKEVFPLFMVSFTWYGSISSGITVIFGLLFSLTLFRKTSTNNDPRLMIPIFDRLFCCFPEKWRKTLRCGIPYEDIEVDELGRFNMDGLEEFKSEDVKSEKNSELNISSVAEYSASTGDKGIINDAYRSGPDLSNDDSTKF